MTGKSKTNPFRRTRIEKTFDAVRIDTAQHFVNVRPVAKIRANQSSNVWSGAVAGIRVSNEAQTNGKKCSKHVKLHTLFRKDKSNLGLQVMKGCCFDW